MDGIVGATVRGTWEESVHGDRRFKHRRTAFFKAGICGWGTIVVTEVKEEEGTKVAAHRLDGVHKGDVIIDFVNKIGLVNSRTEGQKFVVRRRFQGPLRLCAMTSFWTEFVAALESIPSFFFSCIIAVCILTKSPTDLHN